MRTALILYGVEHWPLPMLNAFAIVQTALLFTFYRTNTPPVVITGNNPLTTVSSKESVKHCEWLKTLTVVITINNPLTTV